MKRPVDIVIDDLTPCLKRLSDGEIVLTTIKEIRQNDPCLKSVGWIFDWMEQSRHSGKIVALYAADDPRIQGLVALTEARDMNAVSIDLVESAPWNSGYDSGIGKQEFSGVGGHLFAVAVRESYACGYNGFVVFTAKTKLIDYYRKAFDAKQIGKTANMYLDEKAARRLYERYY